VDGAVDLFLFNATVTQAADNAANSWSDADMALCVGVVPFAYPFDSALNRVLTWQGQLPFKCAATTLYGGFVTRSANAAISSATAMKVKLYIDQQ
jgi:phosphoribosylamine-glycine ligase